MIAVSRHFICIGLSVPNDETRDGLIQESILNLFPLIMFLTSQTLSFSVSLATAHGQSDLETGMHGKAQDEGRDATDFWRLIQTFSIPTVVIGESFCVFGEHIYLIVFH